MMRGSDCLDASIFFIEATNCRSKSLVLFAGHLDQGRPSLGFVVERLLTCWVLYLSVFSPIVMPLVEFSFLDLNGIE